MVEKEETESSNESNEREIGEVAQGMYVHHTLRSSAKSGAKERRTLSPANGGI